jgi:tetratricopeptide (TPR) repeat protein
MLNLAFSEANELYQQALSLADLIPQNKRLIHLYLRCAWNDRLLGLYNQSLEYSQKAFQLAQKENKKTEINLILLQQAFTYFRLREWEKAIADFKQCLKNKINLSLYSQATTHYGLASTNFEMGNYTVSRQHFEEAITIIQKLNGKPSVTTLNARILNNLGALESVTGNHMQAIQRYSQSIPLYEKADDSYGLAQVYNNIGLTYAEGQNWAEANNSYGKSLSYCDLVGNIPLKSIIFLNRAYAFTQLDKIEEAEEYNTKAHRLVKKIDDQLSMAEFHKIQGIVERKEGHWIKAINHFDTALEKFKTLNNMLGYAESAYERGLLALDMNDEKDFNKWLKLSMRNYRELGLGKKVIDITKTLNSHISNVSPTNLRKKNASVKSL